ncbi:MAG: 4-hydroxy-tetrahydrodipicolinate reductase [Clostridia bacterium]|nr:4-hydroxy-tetrahydrodipicolinate reductase [Clostridia bacterium]
MNILFHGICGRIGQETVRITREGYRDANLVCGVDLHATESLGDLPCYTSFDRIDRALNIDCIIDFSHHTAIGPLLKYAMTNRLPVVVATTGHTEEELALIDEAAKVIPIFRSGNMSLGVSLLIELAKTTAANMPDANIEIIETHHNRKLDAPSGTALMIADAIRTVRRTARYVLGRSGQGKREDDEIGIHAIRMGNVVGTHEVIVGTDSQTITLKHEAHSRALFAEGALAAAAYLCGKPAGMYNMQSMIAEQNGSR